jgi:hypothetical protein
MPALILVLMVCGALAVAPGTTTAAEKSIGQTFGEAGRAVVDDSRRAYQNTRHFAVETGENVAEGARQTWEEAKEVGPKIAHDVKSGFQGSGRAPDPTKEKAPVPEKP